MNIKTVALSEEQLTTIIKTLREGFPGSRPNNRIATALLLEANLGLRLGDVLNLHLKDIIQDGERLRLDITEEKTGKKRTFTVPIAIYQYMRLFCIENGIKEDKLMFPITTAAVQKQLRAVCEHLGYKNISSHSFRKYFASKIYVENNYNIVLVQRLLQHSTPAVTQRYIGIQTKELEEALEKNIKLDI